MSAENTGRELGWEDVIEKENQFIILPEGDYDFTVESFDRARHNGSEKVPACNKAYISFYFFLDLAPFKCRLVAFRVLYFYRPDKERRNITDELECGAWSSGKVKVRHPYL